MKVRVRQGYVLFLGNRSIEAGTIVDVSETDLKSQIWKVEAVNEPTPPIQEETKDVGKELVKDRMIRRSPTKRDGVQSNG